MKRLALVVLLSGLMAAPALAASPPIIPSIPGFAGRSVPAATVLPRAAAATAAGHPSAAGRFGRGRRAKKETIVVSAFELASARDAKRLITRLRRGYPRASVVATARVGSTVAVVRYSTRKPTAASRRFVKAVARQEAALIAAWASRTAWDDLAIRLGREHGAPSPATARFALALLGVRARGVPTLRGRIGQTIDRSLAIQTVMSAYPRLSAAQRAAFDRFFSRTFPSSASVASAERGLLAVTTEAEYQALVDALLPQLEANAGLLGFPIKVRKSNDEIGAAADTGVFGPGGSRTTGPPSVCDVTVYRQTDARSFDEQRLILLHEFGHCYQGKHRGVARFWADNDTPPWVAEGLPTWMANATAKIILPGKTALARFDTYPDVLTSFDYPGAGFFGITADVIGEANMWQRVRSIMNADTTKDAIEAAVTSNFKEAFDHWGPARTNDAASGQTWTRSSPVAQQFAATPEAVLVGAAPTNVTPTALTGRSYDIQISTPLVQIEPIGDTQRVYGWIHDAAGFQFKANAPPAQWFCTRSECVCPADQDSTIPSHQNLRLPLTAGLAGGLEGGTGIRLTGSTLEPYCRPRRNPPPPGGGRRGGTSNGDPHLTTLDAVRYDFQAAGEFTLVKSTTGDLEVQARQEPFGKSKTVSVNTMLGFKIGAARVTIAAGSQPIVRIGGKVRSVGGSISLAGGGSIAPGSAADGCPGFTLRWSDSSAACVWPVGQWGLAVNIAPAGARRGRLVGLLGNFDGDRLNEFRTRAGKPLESDVVLGYDGASFAALYRSFGESWRIAQSASLLDYASGEATVTFTKKGFPARFATVGTLGAGQRARAEATCRSLGVTDIEVLEDCILDVASTGEDAFARAAAEEEDLTIASTAWQTVSGLERADGTPSIAAVGGDLHIAAGLQEVGSVLNPVTFADVILDGAGAARTETLAPPGDALTSDPIVFDAGGVAQILGGINAWPGGTPGGVASRGLMQWTRGPGGWSLADRVASGGLQPQTAFRGPDGATFTATVGYGGGSSTLWRGTGAGATQADPPFGEGCYYVNASYAVDGDRIWAIWHEWDCTDPARYGYFFASVDPATGAFGPSTHVPVADGFTQPLYEGLGAHLPLFARSGIPGAWTAYMLLRDRVQHLMLYRLGDATATDLGPVPYEYTMPFVAAAGSGRLWIGWIDRARRYGALMRFRRTTPAGTAFDDGLWTVTLPQTADATTPYVSSLQLAARGESLDLVTSIRAGSNEPAAVWHTRLQP